jgi:hypothetical protein
VGWPKGKPRKGHINKDGTAHARKGEKLARELQSEVRVRKVTPDPEGYSGITVVKPQGEVVSKSNLHGVTGRPVIEPCPNCGFAYADGGWCEECNWSKPRPVLAPPNSIHGRKFKR